MANDPKTDQKTDSKLITVSMDDLKKMIQDGVVECMATLQPELETKTNEVNYDRLAGIIGGAVAEGIGKNTRPKVTIGQYLQTAYSAFHPNGPGKKLNRIVWQNNALLREDRLTDAEIDLLNQITHSGRYIERLVEVVVGFDGADEVCHIRYNNKTVEQQFELKGKARNFEDMLRQIVTAQESERAEDDAFEKKFGMSRNHFSSRATREARARAGV